MEADVSEDLKPFLEAYNFAKRLKMLRGLTPYECICNAWADEPDRFRYSPIHLTSGLEHLARTRTGLCRHSKTVSVRDREFRREKVPRDQRTGAAFLATLADF
jgi:hypothetical protein